MAPPPTIPEPLWTFLYGRRRHRRHDVSCHAVLHGPGRPLACRIVDISGGGLLLHVDRATLTPATPRGGGLVTRNFGHAFQVELLAPDLVLEAELARLAWRPGDDDHVYAGCRFPRPLADATLRRLGIRPELGPGEPTERSAAACLPLAAGDGEAFTIVLHEAGEDQRTALFQGPLIGAGRNTLAAHLEEAALDDVASTLDACGLVIAVHRGLEPMWTVRARPLAVRALPAPHGGVEAVVLADASPSALLTSGLMRTDAIA